jgi:hypothetical protein
MFGDLLEVMVELFQKGRSFLILLAVKVRFLELFFGVGNHPGQPLIFFAQREIP